jgi:hypothetical protein
MMLSSIFTLSSIFEDSVASTGYDRNFNI